MKTKTDPVEGLSEREQRSLENKAAWHAERRQKSESQAARAALASLPVEILKGQALADELRAKVSKALAYLDDHTLLNSSGKDLALIVAILMDKMQLIEGKPTALYDVQISHRIEIMMPQFMAEAKRRGLTLDGDFKVEVDKAVAAEMKA